MVETKISDLLAKNPECAACEFLRKCCGGCMIEGITDEGDYLVPDGRCCYFHRQIGEDAVRAAERENMMKIADPDALSPYVKAAAEACPKAAADYLRGKKNAYRQIVGAVMRDTAGRADPVLTEKLVLDLLHNMNR